MDLKYLKHAVFYFLTAVISLILIYYVGYHLFDGFSQTVSTTAAEKVTQNHTLTLDGYLLRSEQYVCSAKSGEVGYLLSNGDKTAAGVPIAQVYAATNPAVRAQIMALDEKIALYERSSAVSGITASDTSVIDRQISRLCLLLTEALNAGDAEYVYRKQSELLILLNQRAVITKEVTGYRGKIAELQAEKERLTASLSSVTETVTSPASGFFYSHIDGYEELFHASRADTLTVEQFEQLTQSEPLSSSEKTEQGWRIGKLVTDYKWYVACTVDYTLARSFVQGQSYSVLFPYNGDMALPMTLTRLVTSIDEGKALLLLEAAVMPEDFSYLRMQTVNIVLASYDGYRVPVSAVRLVDGVQGVYVLEGNYVRFRAVEPLYEDNGYLIVKSEDLPERQDGISYLAQYDEIITEGKDMYDGKIIR